MTNVEKRIAHIRIQAVEINMAFAELVPMLDRIHLMSFNAKLASHRLGVEGMSFSVIVTEVRAVAEELRVLIKEAEEDLRQVVNESAYWVKSEEKVRLLQKAISIIRAESQDHDSEKCESDISGWGSVLDPGIGKLWKEQQGKTEKGSIEHQMWVSLIDLRYSIRHNVMELDSLAKRLTLVMGRIDLVASRKSDFLAITSMIESARVADKNSGLSTVSEKLRILATDIAQAEVRASNQTSAFLTNTSNLARMVRGE